MNNYTYGVQQYINGDQGDIKIDYAMSDKDHIYGRYSESSYTNPMTRADPLLYNSFNLYPTHTGLLDWTRTDQPVAGE